MPRNHPARQRLIDAAFELLVNQGFSLTTTRQVADLAQVNEATLFRNFKGKHDLLLAVIEDSGIFTDPPKAINVDGHQPASLAEAVRCYAEDRLHTLARRSELLRALVGEAGQYSVENRRALGQGLRRSTLELAQYLTQFIEQEPVKPNLSPVKFAGLLNSLLFGYLTIELTSEFHGLWRDRADFLDSLVMACLPQATGSSSHLPSSGSIFPASDPAPTAERSSTLPRVRDLPAPIVRSILQQAQKHGPQTYAIAYLLFGAGLLPQEILGLARSHHICNSRQHLVQINQGSGRQVPVNQWIMGKRYGSYASNPLSRWLKSRKDQETAMFITDQGEPLSESDLHKLWSVMTAGLVTPENMEPSIEQARQTWCVEMLMKGISPNDLSILTDWSIAEIQPYVRRAREKAALERAIQLDHRPD